MTIPHPPKVILVTGIMGSGKSTTGEQLAERQPRSARVRGDAFRTMIVGGRAEFELSPSVEAWWQTWLRYRIAADVIKHCVDAGFTVV